jgi:ribonuclease HII
MAWIIGVDEAGYGPNLGPLVMTSVACRVPDDAPGSDLWQVLRTAVRKAAGDDDGRLVVDDSKKVYGASSGLGGLELGVLASLWRGPRHAETSLRDFVGATCTDSVDDLRGEAWYAGDGRVPAHTEAADLTAGVVRFDRACASAGLLRWEVRGVLVAAPRFNVLAEEADSKGAVLAHALARLLATKRALLEGESLHFVIDKHGGRNSYAAMIQHALPDGMVLAEEEGSLRSCYRVVGLDREVRLTFRPRADAEHFCVALASMTAKYLRERLMEEFNRFWLTHVPGLAPTAGYPNDAVRFMDAIRPAARKLAISEDSIWRKR